MTDSGRTIGECEHNSLRNFCPFCLQEQVMDLQGQYGHLEADKEELLRDVKRLQTENEAFQQALKPLTLLNPDEDLLSEFAPD